MAEEQLVTTQASRVQARKLVLRRGHEATFPEEEAPSDVMGAIPRPHWSEQFQGGSAEAERLSFEALARDIMQVQLKNKQRSGNRDIARAFHAKSVLAIGGAKLRFIDDLPDVLRVGHVRPSAVYETTVRFSNASAVGEADFKPDLRGIALRVHVSEQVQQDLLMTNFPVSHARDARQFVAFAKATAGNRADQVLGLGKLALEVGPLETVRMLRNVQAGRNRVVSSLALETYWSRGAMSWGPHLAVRYLLRPVTGAAAAHSPSKTDPSYLRREIEGRLAAGDIVFELCIQHYRDPISTPIEDTSIEWTAAASPPIVVAELSLPRQDVDTATARAIARGIEEMAFNPWNTTADFRPLGNLNRARKNVYDASAAHRKSQRWFTEVPLRNTLVAGVVDRAIHRVNRIVEWHRLPPNLSLLNLDALRRVLRNENLIDTEQREAPPAPRSVPEEVPEALLTRRSYDGSYNDLSLPSMGAKGSNFGRNLQPVYRPDSFDVPNPVDVSRELLQRETFIPARSLNLLAASWIQFQVHDWVDHARYPLGERDVVVPMPRGQTWRNQSNGPEERAMRFGDDRSELVGGRTPIYFGNTSSHWWDGSEVYGPDERRALQLREGAMLRLEDGYLPRDMKGQEVTGFNQSWWLGLSGMHTLFAREHNAVCDALRAEYRNWDDERVYHTARLVVSALLAKIHTVEWTPAILATKAIEISLNANWGGPPQDLFSRIALWLLDAHALTGITKTTPDHHAAPYSLTEEFVSVYRMHPLIPDDYTLLDSITGRLLATPTFLDIQGEGTDEVMRKVGLDSTLYSFGVAHPGAITLHNYPRSLCNLERDGGERFDLSVIDIVRNRRRGVPRYNDFRTGLHRPRLKHFEELSDNPESVRRIKALYRGDIDAVDTMVGLFAETPPEGFGFSDTAFRVFILMASRRLQSDRFLTVDFRPEIYSPLGMDWVANNGMTSVLLRHCPGLAAVLPRTASAFAPWRPILGGNQ
jgi:Animal haem peroxidase/Catalase